MDSNPARPVLAPSDDSSEPDESTRRSRDSACTDLGRVTINGTSADLYVCNGLAIARFGDGPEQVVAQHLHTLEITSNVFLLTAFRLYLDVVGPAAPSVDGAFAPRASLQS